MPEQPYRTIDKFDRMMGSIMGLPDVTRTKPTTVTVLSPLIGEAQTFTIQTFRQAEVGDTVFLQYAAAEGLVRLAIPPAAVNAIVRQRDALSTKNRRAGAAKAVKTREAAGIIPGFLKNKKARITSKDVKAAKEALRKQWEKDNA
jgi:hypothetical protein